MSQRIKGILVMLKNTDYDENNIDDLLKYCECFYLAKSKMLTLKYYIVLRSCQLAEICLYLQSQV